MKLNWYLEVQSVPRKHPSHITAPEPLIHALIHAHVWPDRPNVAAEIQTQTRQRFPIL